MKSFTFRGMMPPVFTPFKADFSLNLEIIPEYVKYLHEKKFTGILVNGTTGEGPSLSVEERKQVSEAWVKAGRKYNMHVMLQVGGAPFPDVKTLAKHAEAIGADSILTLPELYIKPVAVSEVVNYLKLISEVAPNTPLLYYNIPMFTDDKLNMAELITQAKKSVKTFKGIKFTSNDLEKGKAAIKACGDDSFVFLGADTILLDAFTSGFDSSIGTTFNMLPNGIDIVASIKNNRKNEAQEPQDKLNKTIVTITQYGNWVESMKGAMRLLTQLDVGPTRPPLKQLSQADLEKMNGDLVKLGYKTYL